MSLLFQSSQPLLTKWQRTRIVDRSCCARNAQNKRETSETDLDRNTVLIGIHSISGRRRSALFNLGAEGSRFRRIQAANRRVNARSPTLPTGPINFCPKCCAKFDRLTELRAHMIRVCGFESRKMCPYCDTAAATTVDQIHRHIERRHPTLRPAVLEVYNVDGNWIYPSSLPSRYFRITLPLKNSINSSSSSYY